MQTFVDNKRVLKEYSAILVASILYAISTHLFIFPSKVLLGGTSGIALILASLLPHTPGTYSVIMNSSLIVLAFLILGKDMAIKTLIGSSLTTVFIGVLEKPLSMQQPLVQDPYIAAIFGAIIIAIASAMMFYVDSSSGGTDIVALIVRRFSRLHIGKALLVTDILIVIVGGLFSDIHILISSFIGLLIKTLGIDAVIYLIEKFNDKGAEKNA